MLTASQLKNLFPQCKNPDTWAAVLPPVFALYAIDTPARIASFLAQTGHESGQFNRLCESLIYSSPQRLMKVWPKRFLTPDAALPYVNNEAQLANYVYANRLGNGPATTGDGYNYRGRGLIQVTGRSNYADAGKALGLDLVGKPDLLLEAEYAAMSAAWFWNARGLNALADAQSHQDDLQDFTEMTRRINGGTTGLKDRLALLKTAEQMLA